MLKHKNDQQKNGNRLYNVQSIGGKKFKVFKINLNIQFKKKGNEDFLKFGFIDQNSILLVYLPSLSSKKHQPVIRRD